MNCKVDIIGIIPARMASTRFPNKPLKEILGIPMIGHVYCRSKMSLVLKDVYVATCDKEIADYIEGIGGKTVMTSDTHERASDRTAEALSIIQTANGNAIEIVVMIQGDEPMLHPEMIDNAAKHIMNEKNVDIVNLVAPIQNEKELYDKNIVKIVMDKNNFAMYFSRESIPSPWKVFNNSLSFKQTGIILFKKNFLIRFNELTQTPLEKVESVDMLRVLENGYKIKAVLTKDKMYSVDTEEDLQKVQEMMKNDDLISIYPISDS